MLAGMEKMIGHMRLAVPPPQEIFNPAAKNFRGVLHPSELRLPCQWVDSVRRDETQLTALGRIDRSQFGEFRPRLRSCRPESRRP